MRRLPGVRASVRAAPAESPACRRPRAAPASLAASSSGPGTDERTEDATVAGTVEVVGGRVVGDRGGCHRFAVTPAVPVPAACSERGNARRRAGRQPPADWRPSPCRAGSGAERLPEPLPQRRKCRRLDTERVDLVEHPLGVMQCPGLNRALRGSNQFVLPCREQIEALAVLGIDLRAPVSK